MKSDAASIAVGELKLLFEKSAKMYTPIIRRRCTSRFAKMFEVSRNVAICSRAPRKQGILMYVFFGEDVQRSIFVRAKSAKMYNLAIRRRCTSRNRRRCTFANRRRCTFTIFYTSNMFLKHILHPKRIYVRIL